MQPVSELQCCPFCIGTHLHLSGCSYSLETLQCCLTALPGVICCMVLENKHVSGDLAFFFYSDLGFFPLAFKWFSLLKSVSSHSPRTKVLLSLLLFPRYSSSFPSAFASLDRTWCCRCYWNVCGNVCTIWKGEGTREEWKAAWAGMDLTSWASVLLCIVAGIHFNRIHMCIVLVCYMCDREGQDESSVCCTKKQVTFLPVKVSSHSNHLLKEVVNLHWGLQIKAWHLPWETHYSPNAETAVAHATGSDGGAQMGAPFWF